MTDDLMRYDQLWHDALRGVIRAALERAASEDGLPGQHHFYITFKTRAVGVELPPHLLEQYADEMTIVLKSHFWELEVRDREFSVGLSFNKVPARITVPYAAITRFIDPAVTFQLQLDVPDTTEAPNVETVLRPPSTPTAAPSPSSAPSEPAKAGEVVSLDAFRKQRS